MVYKDFIRNITATTGYTQHDVDVVIKTMADVITEAVIAGDEVSIPKFGKFVQIAKPDRNCINPTTGEPVVCPAHNVIKFKPSVALKEAVR